MAVFISVNIANQEKERREKEVGVFSNLLGVRLVRRRRNLWSRKLVNRRGSL